jgi:hypothetical protein
MIGAETHWDDHSSEAPAIAIELTKIKCVPNGASDLVLAEFSRASSLIVGAGHKVLGLKVGG